MGWWIGLVVLLASCSSVGHTIQAEPAQAFVYRDGQLIGRTPVTTTTDEPLVLFAPGYQEVQMRAGIYKHPIIVHLEPLGANEKPAPWTARRAQGWMLSKQAIRAAQAGDCEGIAVVGAQVRELDLPLFEQLFQHERSIVACQGSP
jgi:hypothetical protein